MISLSIILSKYKERNLYMPKLASDLGNTINKSRKALPNSNIRAFDEKNISNSWYYQINHW